MVWHDLVVAFVWVDFVVGRSCQENRKAWKQQKHLSLNVNFEWFLSVLWCMQAHVNRICGQTSFRCMFNLLELYVTYIWKQLKKREEWKRGRRAVQAETSDWARREDRLTGKGKPMLAQLLCCVLLWNCQTDPSLLCFNLLCWLQNGVPL
jgi:hypothetical protein